NLADGHVDRPRYIAARDALEERFGERVLSLDGRLVRRWDRLSGEAKRASGHAPPVIDTMLAATAIEHELYLVTRNVKVSLLSGVSIIALWNVNPAILPLSFLPNQYK